MKMLSENLSRYLYRAGRSDSVFKYASLLVARNDSLIHLRKLPWYPSIYNDRLFSKLVPYIENDRKGEIVIEFLCKLADERVLPIIYQKYLASDKSNIKVLYLKIVEYFAENSESRTKNNIKTWLSMQSLTRISNLDEVLNRIGNIRGIVLKPPLPSIQSIADSLKDAVTKKQMNRVADYVRRLIGNDYAKDFSKLQEQNSFDNNFFKNAISLFQSETGETGNNLAELLRRLADPRVPEIIYEEFHKTDKTNPKLLGLKVLEGLTKADLTIRRGCKTWLGTMRHFEKSAEVNNKMKSMYAMFRPVRTPQKVWVSNIKLSVESGKISVGLADSLMGLAELDTLRLLKSDDIFGEKFYEKALEFLKNNNEYISRSMALFLSQLQNKNKDLRKQITDKYWKANSDANVRRLCLVILAGVAQNLDQKDDVIKWLDKNRSQEPKEAIDQILSNIKMGRN